MRLFTKTVFPRLRIVTTPNREQWRTYTSLSYIHHVGNEPLRAITIGNLLEMTVHKYPDREAIVSMQQNKRLTYQQVLEEADKFAAGLQTIGLRYKDRVGIWAPNLAEWIIAITACARIGCIAVAINPGYQTKEIKYCINKVGIKALVCPHKIKKANFYDILNEVSPSLEKSEAGKLNCAEVPSLKSVITISDDILKGTYNYNELLNLAEKTTVEKVKNNQHLIQPDDMCNIQFTSGTTGQPKATIVSHFNLVNNSFHIGKRNELDLKHHKICVQVPLFHTFGITVAIAASFNFGSTIVLPSPSYSAEHNLEALQQERCTIIYGTPTMYVDLIHKQKDIKSSIQPEIALTGGSPCSPKLFKEMKQVLGVKRVKSIFGMTETTAVSFQSLSMEEDEYKATETVGHLHDHLEAKVVDESGKIVPMGSSGELCIRGYSIMLGYWDDEAKTKETIGIDGWLKTGDLFVLQKDGYGRIVGRSKDMIIRGGENIFPKEIEDFLNTHPDILESQVIGLTHERLGEEVCVCVRIRQGAELTQKSLVNFCKGKLAHFKIPTQLRIVKDFPKTTSGKIQKYILRQQVEKS